MFLFFKENLFKIILILILLVILVYVTNITSIPESIILFENDEFNLDIIAGLKLEETIPVGSNLTKKSQNDFGKKEYNISLLGLNVRTITTNTIPKTKVIPLGNLIGLKLYTEGVLVVGVSQIKGQDNKIYKPYEQAGIKQGDSIIEINNEEVNTTEELISCVSRCNGNPIDIIYINEGKVLETQIVPVETEKDTYKIGLWVRDAEAGIGTATFYESKSNSFAALGHGIQDVDTQELVDISSGELVTSQVLNIQKGKKDNPGKIEGTIENSKKIGEIYSNTNFGIYGNSKNIGVLNIFGIKEVEVASRKEITLGKAKVICTLEDGKREEYELEIQKIYINNNKDNKSMLVKITDDRLLEKTGGIIQGMSGSPIIQNNKLVGALTHVLLSDSTKGYALFADTMVSQMRTNE